MIRKIAIGVDYKNCMTYTIGQRFSKYEIYSIRYVENKGYEIFILNEKKEVILWKLISVYTPIVVEYFIKDF